MRQRATSRALAVTAAVLGVGVTCLYWVAIGGQGDQQQRRPQLVAASLLLAALALILSAVIRKRSYRLLLLAVGTSTLLIWAVLGALSIGVLLVPSVVLGLVASSAVSEVVPSRSAWTAVLGGAGVSLLTAWLVLGSS